MKVWVDASPMATGVTLEVNGSIVKITCWLYPTDAKHINFTKIHAMIRVINLALQ